MRELATEETIIPSKIWEWLWNILEVISDEVGIEKKGEYLLAYEGWSGICVSKVFVPTKSKEENENRYYKFAKEKSNQVIEEWIDIYKEYYLIDSGHEPIGLYGVTWALFKKFDDKKVSKSGKKKGG